MDELRVKYLARKFTYESLNIQRTIAMKLKSQIGKEKIYIYIYDCIGYFNDGDEKETCNIRYKEKDGNVAVLSQTAQNVFMNVEEYKYFASFEVTTDDIGASINE